MQTKKSNKELINCFKDYIGMKEMDLMSFMINEVNYENTWNFYLHNKF